MISCHVYSVIYCLQTKSGKCTLHYMYVMVIICTIEAYMVIIIIVYHLQWALKFNRTKPWRQKSQWKSPVLIIWSYTDLICQYTSVTVLFAVICYSSVLVWCSSGTRLLLVCTRLLLVCASLLLVCYSSMLVCYSAVLVCYWSVFACYLSAYRLLVVCTGLLLVYTHLLLFSIRLLLVCTHLCYPSTTPL